MKKNLFLLCLFLCAYSVGAQELKVTASSVEVAGEQFKASNIFDGDMATRWSSNFADKQFLKIEFPQVFTLKEIEIFWEVSHAKFYKVKVSADGKKWKLIHVEKDKQVASADQIKLTDALEIKYMTIEFIKRKTQYGHSIFEIKINGKSYPNFIADINGNKGGSSSSKANEKSKPRKPDDSKNEPQKPKKTGDIIYI